MFGGWSERARAHTRLILLFVVPVGVVLISWAAWKRSADDDACARTCAAQGAAGSNFVRSRAAPETGCRCLERDPASGRLYDPAERAREATRKAAE